jgi:hypothetical protein
MTEWGSPKLCTWSFDHTANGGIHKANGRTRNCTVGFAKDT